LYFLDRIINTEVIQETIVISFESKNIYTYFTIPLKCMFVPKIGVSQSGALNTLNM